MENWKSHALLSAGGIVQSGSGGPRAPGSRWHQSSSMSKGQKHRCLRAGEMGISVHEESRFDLSPLFFLSYSGSWIKSCPPTWWGWLSLLILLIQMLISPRNTLTDTLRNYALPALWVSCSPVKLTHKINHHMDDFLSPITAMILIHIFDMRSQDGKGYWIKP